MKITKSSTGVPLGFWFYTDAGAHQFVPKWAHDKIVQRERKRAARIVKDMGPVHDYCAQCTMKVSDCTTRILGRKSK